MRPLKPQFYCLMLRNGVDNFIVHHTIFDNPQEADWLGKKIVNNDSADAYQVFPITVSKDSYDRMRAYLRFESEI